MIRLLSAYIQGFGILQDRKHTFTEGINEFCEENGAGKSTFAVFIKAMLYGLPSGGRIKNPDENERNRYRPWNGSVFGGSLTLSVDGHPYRIERTFGKTPASDVLQVLDLQTNAETDALGSVPGVSLLHMDADAFESSLYFSQRTLEGREAGMTSLSQSLMDVHGVSTKADMEKYEKAYHALEQYEKELNKRSSGSAIAKLEEEIRTTEGRLRDAKQEKNRALELKQEKESLTEKAESEKEACAKLEEACERQKAEDVILQQARDSRNLIAGLEEEVRTKEQELQNALEPFGDVNPDGSWMAELERLFQSYHVAKVAADECRPDEREFAQFDEIHERYAGNVPQREQLNDLLLAENNLRNREKACQSACAKYPEVSEEKIEHDRTVSSEMDTIALRMEIIRTNAPAGGTLESSEQAFLKRARENGWTPEDMERDLERVRESGRSQSSGGLWLGLGLCGLVLALIFILLPLIGVLPKPLLAPGVFALGVGGFGLAYFFRQKGRKEKASLSILEGYGVTSAAELAGLIARFEQLKDKEKEMDSVQSRMEEQLRYAGQLCGVPVRNEDDFNRLKRECRDRVSLGGQALREQKDAKDALEQAVRERNEKFSPYEKDGIHRSFELLDTDSSRYGTLRTRIEAWEKREDERAKAEKNLSLYLSVLPAGREPTLEARVERIRSDVRRKQDCQNELAVARKNLERASADVKDAQDKARVIELQRSAPDYLSVNREQIDLFHAQAEDRNVRLGELNQELRQAEEKAGAIPELEEDYERLRSSLEETRQTVAVLKATMDYLSRAKEKLNQVYLGPMKKAFENYLQAFDSNRKFERGEVFLNVDLDASVSLGGISRKVTDFSQGQRDLLAICRHFALVHVMTREERKEGEEGTARGPFMILDDPFVNLDDETTKAALRFLRMASEEYQILYFTCHTSRLAQEGNG